MEKQIFVYWDDWREEILDREFTEEERKVKFNSNEKTNQKVQTSTIRRSLPGESSLEGN